MKRVLVAGEINVDLVLQGAHAFPIPGKEVVVDDVVMTLGSASAICAMGLARLGTPVAFLGKVGTDPWGDYCLGVMRAAGIDVSRVSGDAKLKTGVTVSITSPHDRALVSYLGSIRALRADDVPTSAFAGFDHLHVSSYYLQEGLRPGMRALFTRAHEAGLTTSLDPGFDPSERWEADIVATLQETDLFFPNEVELTAITRRGQVADALRQLENGRTRVVAKLGAQGCLTLEGGEALAVPAFRVDAVDTTGAGDSFDAGFLHAWLRGLRQPLHARPGRHRPPGRRRRGRAAGRLRVITVGGFNTSVDKTLDLDVLTPGAVHRVRSVQSWPGGKGLHVALTVAALGEPVRLVGLIDEAHRGAFESALAARGVAFSGVETKGALRTCLALRDQQGARVTEVLEPGPEVDTATRAELRARFLTLARESTLAVLSGSLPPGFHEGAYGEMVAALREASVRTLVDASGGLLRRAVEARPFLVKPNREEAAALSGEAVEGTKAAGRVARGLAARGVSLPIVSLGAAGAVAVSEGRAVHASVSVPRAAYPVGSGDCLLGGVAVGLARGEGLEEVLRLGVACGAANTLSAETGWLRREDVEALRPRVACVPLA